MPPSSKESANVAESLAAEAPINTQNPALAMPSTTLRIVASSEEFMTGNYSKHLCGKKKYLKKC